MEAVYEFIEAFRAEAEAEGIECWFRVTNRYVEVRHTDGQGLHGKFTMSRGGIDCLVDVADTGRLEAERVVRDYRRKREESNNAD